MIQQPLDAEVLIYSVNIEDISGAPITAVPYLGNLTNNRGIQITISDLSTATGLAATDFDELRLYRSTNALLDVADGLPIATALGVNIGAPPIELDVTLLPKVPLGARHIPPGGIYFLITAKISATATRGHAFTVSVAGLHVGIDEEPPNNIPDYQREAGAGFIADDAHHVVIGAQLAKLIAGGVGIPFGGEPAILILLIGSGLYMIRRYSR